MTGASDADSGVPVDDWDDPPVGYTADRLVPPVMIVSDHTDDAAVTRVLLEFSDPVAGRITVHPTPATTGAAPLAHDLLAALGCAVARPSQERVSGVIPSWQAVKAWVTALHIDQVIVLRAHRLSAAGLERLVDLRLYAGIRLVLVIHGEGPYRLVRRLPAGTAHQVIRDVGEVIGSTSRTKPARAAPDSPTELPPIPDDEVTGFRAEAYRSLAAAEFARVDAVYTTGMAAACRWMHAMPDPGPITADEEPAEYLRSLLPIGLSANETKLGTQLLVNGYSAHDLRTLAAGLLCVGRRRDQVRLPQRFDDTFELQRFLTELVSDSPTRRHTIMLLRGAQAGCLLHGLLIELPRDLFTAAGPGLTGAPVTQSVIARIRSGTASPVHAAALATALFTGFPAAYLSQIPTGALSDDGALLALGTDSAPRKWGDSARTRHAFAVPEPARALLVAARTFLQLRGGAPDRALLSAGVGAAARHLNGTAAACGTALPPPAPADRHWHITIQGWWVGPSLHRETDWTVKTRWPQPWVNPQ
ncbi:hypothetical protein IU485_02750 [Nocardia cyriacigeorgica]|uniref:hypothetical protein n=1 Tax=Nocardia cyriacigeorgica TaxID=135487 RepID=UPI001895C72C|nr:hypothetical protein [Nocardia cyriacigeorgica]MBF6080269.1 hypothetical protein [Nocardia cyriacigeorgica]